MLPADNVFNLPVTVGEPVDVGDAPRGRRRVVPITGGAVAGPRLHGVILPGGADWQLVRPDGLAEIEARYLLRAADGTLIAVTNRGVRHGPADVLAELARGEAVDPAAYYFRTAPVFDAPAGPHDWLTRGLFIGVGERHPDRVVIRVWHVR